MSDSSQLGSKRVLLRAGVLGPGVGFYLTAVTMETNVSLTLLVTEPNKVNCTNNIQQHHIKAELNTLLPP